ncbi:hypothetical protein [Xenorhabdus bovienii]|uniref:hypothetical protein n=1 Tax=Xenorhabdus bovienii TaxID=40576 RepID=UPI00351510F4
MWSFVGNKKQQCWLWYAWKPLLQAHYCSCVRKTEQEDTQEIISIQGGFLVYR